MKSRKEVTISSYDKTAEEYFKVVSEFDLFPEIFEFINLLKPKGRILDLGCGPGQHSLFFAEKGFDVTGIDLSEKMISIAKRIAPDVNFVVMDISKLTFSSNSFNGIWASASLLHIPKEEIYSVLQRLYDLLEADGILYLSLKYGDSEDFLNDYRYGGVKKYYVYYKPEEIEQIICETNFKILRRGLRNKRATYDTNSWIHVFCKK
ncbi:MAG: class I SAM-dependent methyltransferase [Bacteroidota bacterium]